jgi:segregation and condensation protein B
VTENEPAETSQASDLTAHDEHEQPQPDSPQSPGPEVDQAAVAAADQDPERSGDESPEPMTADKAPQDDEPDTLAVPLAELRPALEAVLMVADQPLDQVTLASAVGYPVSEVAEALAALAQEYVDQGRGFDLRNVAGGWRYYTREEFAAVVEKFVLDGQQARLTQAALETLAVVAYKQPVSRARVSAVRGVNVDGVMRTLLARGLVEECGHDQETSAVLYRTTGYFLERIGVTSIDELPELAPFLPEMGDLDEMDEAVAPARTSSVASDSSSEPPADAAGTESAPPEMPADETADTDVAEERPTGDDEAATTPWGTS